jgi:type II secretory pathway component GspD/PulD (secretin)
MRQKPAHIKQPEDIINALGQKRKQVLISFKLAEVSRARLKTLGIDLDKIAYSYDEIKQFHDKDTLALLLRVLNEGKDAKILAEPNLRVIEGEEAKVTIGDRIPLEVEATATTDSGSVLKLNTQLQWVDVGIKMTVKDVNVGPNSGINIKIKGEVSSVVSQTKQGYPQIRTREAESTLRVQNGDSIIMGGLISKEERETRTRIPIIGNIPLFGGLARGRDSEKRGNEIVMVVTAKLIED